MKIGIIGTGRLGLTFALLCEKSGFQVMASDIRTEYVENLNNKICTTNEPFVQEMLSKTNNFYATTDNKKVIKDCDIIFTFVATPSTSNGDYDTSRIFDIIKDFIDLNNNGVSLNGKSFIVGCTTNPGDVQNIQNQLSDFGVKVAYNPEFIAQGEIVKGLEESDIVLIGTDHENLSNTLVEIYSKIQTKPINPCVMSPKAAEITKIGINCFLTTKISFANMIGDILIAADLKEEIGVVLNSISNDTRVGKKYMKYGFGFGGPCLPRDNRALGHFANKVGINLNLPTTVDKYNNQHHSFLKEHFLKINPNKEIPFIMDYITYKKGTDILEESQQLKLCIGLLEEGYSVYVAEQNNIMTNLIHLCEKYNNRLKFYNQKNPPDGIVIDL